jgi:hypothetical protein
LFDTPRLSERSLSGSVLSGKIVHPVGDADTRVIVMTPDGVQVALLRFGGIKNSKQQANVRGFVYDPVDLSNTSTNQKFVLTVYQLNKLDEALNYKEEEAAKCLIEFGERVTQVEHRGVQPRPSRPSRPARPSDDKIFDDAYAAAIRAFSLALKGVPDQDRATLGIASLLSDNCGGSGLAWIDGIDGRSSLARSLKKWTTKMESSGNRMTMRGRSLNFHGLKSDPKIYIVPRNEGWKEAQCLIPQEKAYGAFLDHLKNNGIDTGCAYVRTYVD